MAYSVLQSATATTQNSSVTATFSTQNASSGTKIIAVVSAARDTSLSTVSSVQDAALNSWTQIGPTAHTTGAQVSIWALDTPAGDVGIKPAIKATFTLSAGVGITIAEVSGLLAGNTSAMADGTAGTLAGATATTGSPVYSSTASSEFLIAAYGDFGDGVTVVKTSAAWTMVGSNADGNSNCLLEYTDSTGGTETNGFTSADTGGWAIVMVAFKLAGPQPHPGPPLNQGLPPNLPAIITSNAGWRNAGHSR